MNYREQISKEEDSVPYAYEDSEGYLTIGKGRLIDRRRGGGLSPDEIEYLFNNDCKRVERELDQHLHWWRTLSDERQAVLASMWFQMGSRVLGFVYTLAHIQSGHYADAAVEMLNSKWARQTPARAKRLSKQMETSVWQ